MSSIQKTISIFTKIYSVNGNDTLFNRLIDYECEYTKEFYDIFYQYFGWKTVGKFKKHYKNGISFSNFIGNINATLNNNIFDIVEEVSEEIRKALNIDINVAKKMLGKKLLNIYIGFVFEEMFAELFADFKITSNNSLDMDKIDMLIEYDGKRIGVQFKNISYLRVSNYTKDKNKNVLKCSKRTHKLNMMVYVFHNDRGQPLLLKRKVFDTIEVDKEIYFMDYEETNEHDNEHNYNAYEVTNEEDIIKAFKEIF